MKLFTLAIAATVEYARLRKMSALPETFPQDSLTSERHPFLLFFDGQCVFCNRWVDRVRAVDHEQRMRFGTKQGTTFRQAAQHRPEIANIESVVLAKRRADGGEDFLVRSAAIRELIQGLPRFRFFALMLRVFPAPVSDLGYRIFARLRTPLFGRLAQCRVPREDEKHLFLE